MVEAQVLRQLRLRQAAGSLAIQPLQILLLEVDSLAQQLLLHLIRRLVAACLGRRHLRRQPTQQQEAGFLDLSLLHRRQRTIRLLILQLRVAVYLETQAQHHPVRLAACLVIQHQLHRLRPLAACLVALRNQLPLQVRLEVSLVQLRQLLQVLLHQRS